MIELFDWPFSAVVCYLPADDKSQVGDRMETTHSPRREVDLFLPPRAKPFFLEQKINRLGGGRPVAL